MWQVAVTLMALAAMLLAGVMTTLDLTRDVLAFGPLQMWELPLYALFVVSFAALVYGSVTYAVARLGYLLRVRRYRPQDHAALDALASRKDPPLVTVLVPSYKEEPKVIRQTLLSAALQDYPRKQVVLLIDDPHDPARPEDGELLRRARGLPGDIETQLNDVRARFERMLSALLAHPFDGGAETHRVAGAYAEAATWLERQAGEEDETDHTDALFKRIVYLEPAKELRQQAADYQRRRAMSFNEAWLAYDRLVQRFHARIQTFERKRFINLSHEANKAMNLNSYIGLLGRSLKEEMREDGLYCIDARRDEADFTVAKPDYVITLDADSLLAHDYTLRLVEVMERPENARLGVAQTPYRAVPGATSSVERIAGATTDIQYVMQQGYTWFNGTYWIGANAMLRTAALQDIAVPGVERGQHIVRYIQDQTVIEDTESTIDLVERGWSLYNYPAKLAYSATPPDFGSLIIQRRRWANGGLIILPKLLRYLRAAFRKRPATRLVGEAFVRIHYLLTEATVNFAILFVFLAPLLNGMFSWWFFASAIPYFGLFALDLSREGYRFSDIFRVYALNLLLVPVNLAGTINSIRQIRWGKKMPFGRTPKVEGRTSAPAIYIVIEYLATLLLIVGGLAYLLLGDYVYAAFSLGSGIFLAYAIVTFIGLRPSWEDLRVARRERATARLERALG
jgi:cellulose synthase/poly-beta-1,6-N-acetylglucosamine synthase-like glycosyltransferase